MGVKSGRWAAALAAAALTVGGSAAAQPQERMQARQHGGPAASMIELLDTSGDGKVSLTEITDEQRRLIAAIDVNRDGKLSADEFRRRGRLLMSLRTYTLFDLLDADGDGQLTADEIAAPSKRWLKRYDADKDGAISAEELPQSPTRREAAPGWMPMQRP